MKSETAPNETQTPARLRAAKAVAKDRGTSYTTLWRLSKNGLVKFVDVFGKPYVDMDSLAEFDRRCLAGEFRKGPHGICKQAAEARTAKLQTA